MAECLLDFIKKHDVEFYKSFDISHISSIGIGAVCDYALYPHTTEELINTVFFLTDNNINFFIAARMTNILVCTGRYHGVVVFTNKINRYCLAEGMVSAECGVLFSKMLRDVSAFSLGGIEALFGIPGSVGGMVYNNAGAYGKSISDFFCGAKLLSTERRQVVEFSIADMCFGYRRSILQSKKYILLSADFKLQDKGSAEIRKDLEDAISVRKRTQPYGKKSLGSVFKRCGDIPVSKLIDELGLKGYSVGGASISEKHAGFIVNLGGATADDVLRLIDFIKQKVYREYGVILEEEIEFLK